MGNVESQDGELLIDNEKITAISSDDISTHSKVHTVRLRDNQLTNLPENVECMKSLKTLIIRSNPITQLPSNLLSLPKLETALFPYCNLRTFNFTDVVKSKLIKLSLVSNGIDTLIFPTDSALPSTLSMLDLTGNLLCALPPQFFCYKSKSALPGLQILNLSNNKLTSIPETVNFPQLKVLNASFNRIASVESTSFDGMPSLEQMDFQYNLLQSLPDNCLVSLSKLTELNLEGNDLRDIPKSVFSAKSLTKLNLSHNALTSVDGSFSKFKVLRELNLSHNLLTTCPSISQGDLPSLELLNLSHNKITTISGANLHFLAFLDLLNISFNILTSILASDLPFKRCRVLRLHHNSISSITGDFARFSGLQDLDIASNPLTSLPSSLSNVRLETILASSCQFSTFPEAISSPPLSETLRYLTLSHNNLVLLPQSFVFPQIVSLDISFNAITDLPKSFFSLSTLKTLIVSGNPGMFSIDRSCVPSKLYGADTLTRSQQVSQTPRTVVQTWGTPTDSHMSLPTLSEEADQQNEGTSRPTKLARLPSRTTLQRRQSKLTLARSSPLMVIPQNITTLVMEYTDIPSFPPGFFDTHSHLKVLSVAYNHMTTLPRDFYTLISSPDSSLTTIDFSFNPLVDLAPLVSVPKERLASIATLDLTGTLVVGDSEWMRQMREHIIGTTSKPKVAMASQRKADPKSLAGVNPLFGLLDYPHSFANRLPLHARTLSLPVQYPDRFLFFKLNSKLMGIEPMQNLVCNMPDSLDPSSIKSGSDTSPQLSPRTPGRPASLTITLPTPSDPQAPTVESVETLPEVVGVSECLGRRPRQEDAVAMHPFEWVDGDVLFTRRVLSEESTAQTGERELYIASSVQLQPMSMLNPVVVTVPPLHTLAIPPFTLAEQHLSFLFPAADAPSSSDWHSVLEAVQSQRLHRYRGELWLGLMASRDMSSLIGTALSMIHLSSIVLKSEQKTSTAGKLVSSFLPFIPLWTVAVVMEWTSNAGYSAQPLKDFAKHLGSVIRNETGMDKNDMADEDILDTDHWEDENVLIFDTPVRLSSQITFTVEDSQRKNERTYTSKEAISAGIAAQSQSLGLFAVYDGHNGDQTSNMMGNITLSSFLQAVYDCLLALIEATCDLELEDGMHDPREECSLQYGTVKASMAELTKEFPALHAPPNASLFFALPVLPAALSNKLLTSVVTHTFFIAQSAIDILGTKGGCTSHFVLVTASSIVRANLGDCRSLLVQTSGKEKSVISFSTTDHKTTERSEIERIHSENAFVGKDNRFCDELAVARAIGDRTLSRPISHVSDVDTIFLSPPLFHDTPDTAPVVRRSEMPLFFVMGCDGVFDVVSDEDLSRHVSCAPVQSSSPPAVSCSVSDNLLSDSSLKSAQKVKRYKNESARTSRRNSRRPSRVSSGANSALSPGRGKAKKVPFESEKTGVDDDSDEYEYETESSSYYYSESEYEEETEHSRVPSPLPVQQTPSSSPAVADVAKPKATEPLALKATSSPSKPTSAPRLPVPCLIERSNNRDQSAAFVACKIRTLAYSLSSTDNITSMVLKL